MSAAVDVGSSPAERLMLQVVQRIVPAAERADWTRTWQAELWHWHERAARQKTGTPLAFALGSGCVLDALWLRTDCWRRALRGTALLCLLLLTGACLLAGGVALSGGLHELGTQLRMFLVEAPLVLFVSFATTSRRHLQEFGSLRPMLRLRRQSFFLAKTLLVLLLGFVLSVDLLQPARAELPLAADLLQTLLCVVFSITGLRWAMLDQQDRCKHCLVLLLSPARVGRPSHNLLEWAGTEQICRRGHGMLSSPEMETSWCSHSRWLAKLPEQEATA